MSTRVEAGACERVNTHNDSRNDSKQLICFFWGRGRGGGEVTYTDLDSFAPFASQRNMFDMFSMYNQTIELIDIEGNS